MTISLIAKPRPHLLDKRDAKRALMLIDRAERLTCKRRSGGQCEVREQFCFASSNPDQRPQFHRCGRRASQNHHLIGGSGRRNQGRSVLADHRLDVCDKCHLEITNHVLVPIDGTQREDAATVRYERIR